jgi:hypothetical protein
MPSGLARYNETLKSSPKFNTSKKKVQFENSDDYKILKDGTQLNLNLLFLFRACETNTSFAELALLKSN